MKTGTTTESESVAVAATGGGIHDLTPAERRKRGEDARRRRLAQLKAKLPNRSIALIEGVPGLYQGRLVKALVGECSQKEAIRAHCEQCVGWEDTRPRVGGCTTYACALHAYRPYQEKP